ncbi:hypothetical protein [Spirochaeta dissipatitropha]
MNRVELIDRHTSIRSVLISVSDKNGLPELVSGLASACPGIRIYSTGGSYAAIESIIKEKNLQSECTLISISDYTGQPEMQGGLVKTLDFKIYLGLLSETYNEHHKSDIERTGAEIFDLTVVNLYPFKETIASKEASLEDARANIDIGGPTMIRASAKNFLRVTTLCSPTFYPELINELKEYTGQVSLNFRYRMAVEAFSHIAEYDIAIAHYLKQTKPGDNLYSYPKGE